MVESRLPIRSCQHIGVVKLFSRLAEPFSHIGDSLGFVTNNLGYRLTAIINYLFRVESTANKREEFGETLCGLI